ncbi:MAG: hypothetical protein FWF81_03365 [Defluviitaleaceae bacterium]|nr:hypothetical protein [Defluviitaleaceae bacterium]
MTKVARLFEEEKVEAVNDARKEERLQIARDMLTEGDDIVKIMRVTRLTRTEVDQLQISEWSPKRECPHRVVIVR